VASWREDWQADLFYIPELDAVPIPSQGEKCCRIGFGRREQFRVPNKGEYRAGFTCSKFKTNKKNIKIRFPNR